MSIGGWNASWGMLSSFSSNGGISVGGKGSRKGTAGYSSDLKGILILLSEEKSSL